MNSNRDRSTPWRTGKPLDDAAFRDGLAQVLGRSRLSRRQLSAAMGRDPGYVAALLDPTRPSRARPTPDDLARATETTGIPFADLLEALWGIDGRALVPGERQDALTSTTSDLSDADRASVAAFAAFLASRP